ncbi:LysR family transcriptional regulator [Sedimentibacter hydroxybenzoicus DSM 7310]|uniref:LysR family transcriptional regulator n=1 Tax=Sedimentibacter hydroxybenzoicus DSM 7310 TaxID=1123245 RepID=A0A974BLA5_SEDHY|nr:LysR family transcriptional regulator [Sedimentibacter hydroxybenzoicus DSM 7310]
MKVVELGSISKAADYCMYTQSAVSQIISGIESELNIILLNRSHAGVSLTTEGMQIFPFIKEIGLAYNELSDKVFNLLGTESGMIRIGSYSSISCHLLSPIIKAFCKEYPNIKFEILQGDYRKNENWISDGTVDIGFVALPTRSEFDITPFISDMMLALLPKDHHMSEYDRIPLSIFAEEPFVYLHQGTQKEVIEAFKANNITPRIEYRTEDDYVAMSMVESGLGISILSELVLYRTPYNIVIKETDPPLYRNLAVAKNSKRKTALIVQYFLDFLKEYPYTKTIESILASRLNIAQ